MAVKAGLHPFSVWPEMADHAIESVDTSRRRNGRGPQASVAACEPREGPRTCSGLLRREQRVREGAGAQPVLGEP
jgi:hypothetical protein